MAFTSSANFNTSFSDINTGLFGTDIAQDSITETSQSSASRGTKRLKIDQAAIDKILNDVLSGNEGLAAIFNEEGASGIFKSTQAQSAVGDLLAKVAGEIAKLTGVEEVESSAEQQQQQTAQTSQESSGILDSLFGF